MTNARANIELAIKGQMGQPAACMIENNMTLRSEWKCRVIMDQRGGLLLRRINPQWGILGRSGGVVQCRFELTTISVDNFVENHLQKCFQAAPNRVCNALILF
jgi:hypothetical protein